MKICLMSALVAGLVFTLAPTVSEAKRLGGGKSTGMQRSAPDKPAPTAPAATPNTPAAPAAAAAPTAGAAAAAAAPKRSWMGPLAGLAAGLGLAALLGHFGLGGEFANLLMMLLLGVVAFVVIRMLMKRFAGGGLQPVPAGAAAGGFGRADESRGLTQRTAWTPGAGSATAASGPAVVAHAASAGAAMTPTVAPASSLPEGFDTEGFERIAKTIFIRLQAANDSADLNDLRNFTTPELFASLRVDLHDRGTATQQTDVVTVTAQVLEFAQEADRQIVSVRFQGLMREEADTAASPFDEIWHLVKQGDSPAWAIAGIQQTS